MHLSIFLIKTNFSSCTVSVSGGRLECTMQNIADSFFNTSSSQCYNDVEGINATFLYNCKCKHHYLPSVIFRDIELHISPDILDTFIVYNERRRVTSSAKRTRKHASESLHQVMLFS